MFARGQKFLHGNDTQLISDNEQFQPAFISNTAQDDEIKQQKINEDIIGANKIRLPGSNSKPVSVLFKPNSKSYFVSQYWASLNTRLTSLASLNQDFDNTWKLIPKSKPTFQKISSENFKFKKISQRAMIFSLIFGHFLGGL